MEVGVFIPIGNNRWLISTPRRNRVVVVGPRASITRVFDEMAAVPGERDVMLTLHDFRIGVEQFATRILALMRRREGMRRAA